MIRPCGKLCLHISASHVWRGLPSYTTLWTHCCMSSTMSVGRIVFSGSHHHFSRGAKMVKFDFSFWKLRKWSCFAKNVTRKSQISKSCLIWKSLPPTDAHVVNSLNSVIRKLQYLINPQHQIPCIRISMNNVGNTGKTQSNSLTLPTQAGRPGLF